jgi:hypothetical protein
MCELTAYRITANAAAAIVPMEYSTVNFYTQVPNAPLLGRPPPKQEGPGPPSVK